MTVDKREKSLKSQRVAILSTLFTIPLCQVASNAVRKQRSLKKYRRHATRRDPLNYYKSQQSHKDLPAHSGHTRSRMAKPSSLSHLTLERILDLHWKLPGDSVPYVHDKLVPLVRHCSHLGYALSHINGPHIPETWKVFQTVDWAYCGQQLASSDSSCPRIISDSEDDMPSPSKSTSNSSRAFSSKGSSSASAEYQVCPQRTGETDSATECKPISHSDPMSIVFRKDTALDLRTRLQWNFLATMKPSRTQWRRQIPERALRRDRRRHTGFWDLNQSARNQDLWPQVASPPILSFNNVDASLLLLPSAHEQSWSCIIGRRLVDLIQTEAFPAHYQHATQWPPRISAVGQPPIIDYICRATPEAMGWQEDMCPVLFVAQSCPSRVRNWPFDSRPDTSKIAAAFQPMISLFILYYLDTRITVDDPIPRWMILFGATYSESEVQIWAHYPWLLVKSGEEGREEEWCALSRKSQSYDFEVWRGHPTERGVLLGGLNRIQGHCKYVMHQLKAWEGYDRACKLLGL
ncbi:hypothetical protein M408DRAFT_24354 [Serendipita vermifera MAFF 305830]|uniref:Uncharacterized protein n=1 Tax=Serendipita vermifera MAFF 305830 TaxID=933852 RepID=A0A0C3B8C9_SERVB|nr:hypothetical protein M408DRAFT_24354 [Serendipita vermifera MAFF 305830]